MTDRSPWLRTTQPELLAQAQALGVTVQGKRTSKALWHAIMAHLDENPDALVSPAEPVQRPVVHEPAQQDAVKEPTVASVVNDAQATERRDDAARWTNDANACAECAAGGQHVVHACNRCGGVRLDHFSAVCDACESALTAQANESRAEPF